tara:strand:- start:1492 stop:1986 length:495 start_codon:yes stop_codon:yes gene_type:complete
VADKNKFIIRKVNLADEELILDWSNDFLVRKWSFNNDFIKRSEHREWFKKKYYDDKVAMWIFESSDEPSGLVRFEKKEDSTILNYLISPKKRGRGYASKMLILAMKELQKKWGNVKIMAFTISDNIASKKSLERAGFVLFDSNDVKLSFSFSFEKNNKKFASSM